VSAFIEGHRERFGIEPICRTLEVSVSAYYERRTGRRSPRAIEDERWPGEPDTPQIEEQEFPRYERR